MPCVSPLPSAGEGGPRVSEGRERGPRRFRIDLSRPLSRPASRATLPRRGGRVVRLQFNRFSCNRGRVPDHPRKHRPVDPSLRDFARSQRHDMPTAEALFWQQVRAGRFRGLKFKRQMPIPAYVADFVCLSARVVIELDGPLHDDETRRRYDARRDAWLTAQGFTVLRFSNDLVIGNLGAVLGAIGAAIDARLPPPSAGEGAPRSGGGRGVGTGLSGKGAPLSPPAHAGYPPPQRGEGDVEPGP